MKKVLFVICIGCFTLVGCKEKSDSSRNKHSLPVLSSTFVERPISLFGVTTIKDSTRDELRKSIVNAGGIIRKLDIDPWRDVYDPKKIFDGATSLTVTYNRYYNQFGEAEFIFPSIMAYSVLNLMRAQYGEPSKAEMDQESGLVFATWVNKNNITIRVERDRANDDTSLSFFNLKNMNIAYDEINKEWGGNKYKDQNGEESLALFGVKLKYAQRQSLNDALLRGGLQLHKSKEKHWVDTYDVKNGLKGARTLDVFYTKKDNRFAICEYTFPSFMDPHQIQDVINLVVIKYGQPNEIIGNLKVGPVQAIWRRGDMRVLVSREWPNTTTYLTYVDIEARTILQKELEADRTNTLKNEANSHKDAI